MEKSNVLRERYTETRSLSASVAACRFAGATAGRLVRPVRGRNLRGGGAAVPSVQGAKGGESYETR